MIFFLQKMQGHVYNPMMLLSYYEMITPLPNAQPCPPAFRLHFQRQDLALRNGLTNNRVTLIFIS